MSPKQKEQIVNQIISVLAENNVSYAEVPEVIKEVQFELSELCQQQVIKIS
ncbi:hypothetical protein J7E38_13480 [Bacillus sp. ISL-35]|uniref:hypothetical protein n=1 Tax=Bacillus sp. ISL-35 TaxID=2819122 RepID=UPI001BEBDEA9|nr:hypothetical protein [Bacillus sp. ISL-35]MBT2680020.1 hypothetical protein [Bacillus sp. ISL-35]MBT2703004.1 hypothetical protein [Chryseobacterium sp. ISL-80]